VTDLPLTRPARGTVLAWGFWDWAYSAFNAVATTFVFNTYLSGKAFGDPAHESELLGIFTAVAGVIIALVAPVAGQRSDVSGRRKLWLGINSGVVLACLLGMVFVKNSPGYLWLGLACIAVGTVFYELASVFYNSLLPLVSTPETVGKVSAYGWSMAYFGGIVLLLIILVFFVLGGTSTTSGLLHVPTAGGLSVRLAMLVAAVWAAGFSLPVFFKVKTPRPSSSIAAERTGFFGSYAMLGRNIRGIWRVSPHTIWFLLASAIFRDGLTGVFTFGGVLGHVVFGLSTTQVLMFGIAANVIAGGATVSSGRLDDRFGPKPLIVISLTGMIACAILMFVTRGSGALMFWIFGLILCAFVGPAGSASRTFLSRIIPPGREGEVFGLYATTGRAAIWISPLLYSAAIAISPATGTAAKTSWGILGITLVLIAGLAVLLPVKSGQDLRAPELEDTTVLPFRDEGTVGRTARAAHRGRRGRPDGGEREGDGDEAHDPRGAHPSQEYPGQQRSQRDRAPGDLEPRAADAGDQGVRDDPEPVGLHGDVPR
jgi:UMF1 family MFS transporter